MTTPPTQQDTVDPAAARSTGPSAPPPATPVDDARAALRRRPFRLLTGAWALSNFADSILTLILAVWVKDLTGSSGAGGLVFAALGVPALAAPLLGQVADRMSRRRMMVITYTLGAAILLTLFAVQGASQVWLVYVVTIGYSTIGFATASAQSGLVRDMLPDSALGVANGRLTTIDQVFRLLMPLVGAAVYVAVGPKALVAAAAVAFALAAALISRIRMTETPPTSHEDRKPFVVEVMAGFRHLASTPPLGTITLALVVGFGAVGLLNAASFAIIEDGLGLGPEMLGPVSSVQGVTAIVAGLTAARLIARLGSSRVVSVGLALIGAGTIPAMTDNLAAVLAGLGLVGLGATWAIIAFVTERQLRTPAVLQGRVSAASNMLVNVPQLVMTVVASSLLGIVDYRLLLGVTAAGLLVAGLVALRGRGPFPARAQTAVHPA